MKRDTWLIIFICLCGFFVAVFLLKTHGIVKVDAPSPLPAIEESTPATNQPDSTPSPMSNITKNADGSLTLSIDETGWVSVSNVITLHYIFGYDSYKIVIPKNSVQLRKTAGKNDTIYVESTDLVFSQIDSSKSLQKNIDSYLIGASLEYFGTILPPEY